MQLQRFGERRHAFEVLPVPYSVVPWVAPKPEHRPTNFRIDDGRPVLIPDHYVIVVTTVPGLLECSFSMYVGEFGDVIYPHFCLQCEYRSS